MLVTLPMFFLIEIFPLPFLIVESVKILQRLIFLLSLVSLVPGKAWHTKGNQDLLPGGMFLEFLLDSCMQRIPSCGTSEFPLLLIIFSHKIPRNVYHCPQRLVVHHHQQRFFGGKNLLLCYCHVLEKNKKNRYCLFNMIAGQ